MSPGAFQNLVQSNVLDIRFVRRRPRASRPPTRRMLCTLNSEILLSVNGRTVLNYLPPANNLPYTISDKGLVMVWDILMQNFRMVSSESVSILEKFPPGEEFWNHFNTNIRTMDGQAKQSFMNS